MAGFQMSTEVAPLVSLRRSALGSCFAVKEPQHGHTEDTPMTTGTMRLRELTIRYAVKKSGDGLPVAVARRVTCAKDCAEACCALLQDQASEVFGILCLSTKRQIIAYHEVSRGALDSTLVHPRLCWAEHRRGYVAAVVMWGSVDPLSLRSKIS
jgi:hypothetical protein